MVLATGLAVTPTAAQQPAARTTFEKLCIACHGATGAGDGPAASALPTKPKPFTDSSSVASKTDEELTRQISEGNVPMPSFGKQLSPSQIKALVAYVRELGKAHK